ncbi:hypothetical protein Q5752_002162 [Cryptotrichosporon argae]
MTVTCYGLRPSTSWDTNMSPHVWKTAADFAFLGIEYNIELLTFLEIRGDFEQTTGTPGVTVPTIKTADGYTTDSWKIAEKLEADYAKDGKSLFGSEEGKALAKLLEIWGNTELAGEIRPVVGGRMYANLDDEIKPWAVKNKFGGDQAKAEAMAAKSVDPAYIASQAAAARAKLQLLEAHLAARGTPFLAGPKPTHADAVVFGWYGFPRILNPQAAEATWRHDSLPLVGKWLDAVLATGVGKGTKLV